VGRLHAHGPGGHLIFPDNPRRVDPDDVWRTVEREKANTMTVVGDAVLRPLVMQLDKGTTTSRPSSPSATAGRR
jgi:hypothetical protein